MTLNIMTQFTAKNLTPNARVAWQWGIGPRTITSITIHWWGDPVGQTFGGIVDWFCNPQSSVGTSAHFVASADQVACIVSPEDAAWHAGSPEGNVHSIGIECNPRCSDGDYQSIAELVAWLRSQYGDLPLYAHNHWTQTTCPGDYRLDRIDSLARGLITTQEDELMAALDEPITKSNGGTTTLRTEISWIAQNFSDLRALVSAVPANTLNAKVQTIGFDKNYPTTLGTEVAYMASNFKLGRDTGSKAVASVALAPADIDNIVSQIKAGLAGLPADTVTAIGQKLAA